MFQEMKTLKNFYILGGNFSSLKNEKTKKTSLKRFLYFGKWNFLVASLKKLIFQEGSCKHWKLETSHFRLEDGEFFKQKGRRRKFFLWLSWSVFSHFIIFIFILNHIIFFILWEIFATFMNMLLIFSFSSFKRI